MTTVLNPYLHFSGDARAVMERYQQVFGGELSVMTYGDMGMEGEHTGKVMHSQLNGPGLVLMASDYLEGMGSPTLPTNGHISLSGDEPETLRGWWAGLAEGGTVHDELSVKPWGDEFGALTDRFGIDWVMNIAQPS